MGSSLINRFFPGRPLTRLAEYERENGIAPIGRAKRVREIFSIARRYKATKGFTPEGFREFLEDLGPAFVKVGQTLSTRSEALPPEYCQELAKLQDETLAVPFETIEGVLRKVYGKTFDEIFAEIDPEPVGCASIAQVHKATLTDGRIAALKIQRPGVRATMMQDVDILRAYAPTIAQMMPGKQVIDVKGTVEELWRIFLDELDFNNEAANLKEFNDHSQDVAFVHCPKPYLEYCTPEVLVMEYVDAIPIRDTQRIVDAGYDLKEIGTKLVDHYVKQILEDGFYNADPHPGNLGISHGKVIFFDLGIVGRLNGLHRHAFAQVISAMGSHNASKLKDALLQFAEKKDVNAINHPRLLNDLDMLMAAYSSMSIEEINLGAFLRDLISLSQDCDIVLPPCVAEISRTLMMLDGTLAAYVGEFNFLQIAVDRITRRSFEEENLRTTAEELLISLREATDGLQMAARYSGEAIRMVSRGQMKVNIEMEGSEVPLEQLSIIAVRATIGVVVAGLLVSAGLIADAQATPQLLGMPVLAAFMYIIAFILSAWIFTNIFKKPKKK